MSNADDGVLLDIATALETDSTQGTGSSAAAFARRRLGLLLLARAHRAVGLWMPSIDGEEPSLRFGQGNAYPDGLRELIDAGQRFSEGAWVKAPLRKFLEQSAELLDSILNERDDMSALCGTIFQMLEESAPDVAACLEGRADFLQGTGSSRLRILPLAPKSWFPDLPSPELLQQLTSRSFAPYQGGRFDASPYPFEEWLESDVRGRLWRQISYRLVQRVVVGELAWWGEAPPEGSGLFYDEVDSFMWSVNGARLDLRDLVWEEKERFSGGTINSTAVPPGAQPHKVFEGLDSHWVELVFQVRDLLV